MQTDAAPAKRQKLERPTLSPASVKPTLAIEDDSDDNDEEEEDEVVAQLLQDDDTIESLRDQIDDLEDENDALRQDNVELRAKLSRIRELVGDAN